MDSNLGMRYRDHIEFFLNVYHGENVNLCKLYSPAYSLTQVQYHCMLTPISMAMIPHMLMGVPHFASMQQAC